MRAMAGMSSSVDSRTRIVMLKRPVRTVMRSKKSKVSNTIHLQDQDTGTSIHIALTLARGGGCADAKLAQYVKCQPKGGEGGFICHHSQSW